MHEMALACEVVEQVTRLAEAEGAAGVSRVTLRLGVLSGVERGAFEFAYPAAAEGTVLAGAELAMEEEPAAVLCRRCGRRTEPEVPFPVCGACGSTDVDVVAGRDFTIRSVELEFEGP
ncbi:MAG: hydrogenase maturation nickel metallochaperone HypA [Kiritimatiellae bacterium]|nr:hydrogenase maturation nickel metallochaperone HypA [Kiritimatiellia bacterium]